MKFKQLRPFDDVNFWRAKTRGIQFVITEDLGEFRISFKLADEDDKPANYIEEAFRSLNDAQVECEKLSRRLIQ